MASAKGVRAGRGFIEIGIMDKTAQGLKAVRARLRQAAASVAKIGAAGIAALGGISVAVGIASVRAASDMEETMNKFNVVFGDSADEVKKWSDSVAEAMGRSRQQMADTIASFQDLLVPMGAAPEVALEMSKTLTQLSVDLASFNNKMDADVVRDLQSALTGSSEVMKKYGSIVNMTAVNQELLNQGLDPKAATEVQKAMARYNLILDHTQAAQGDAVRSSGSWANQMKALQANLNNAYVELGQNLLPILTPILQMVVALVKATGVWIERNVRLSKSFGIVAGESSTQLNRMGQQWGQFVGKLYDWTVGWVRDLQVGILQVIRAIADLAVKFDRLMGGTREDNIWSVWLDDIKRKQADIIQQSAQTRQNWVSFAEDIAEAASTVADGADDLADFEALDIGDLSKGGAKPSPTTPATIPKTSGGGGGGPLSGTAAALERGSVAALQAEQQKTQLTLLDAIKKASERTADSVAQLNQTGGVGDASGGLVGV